MAAMAVLTCAGVGTTAAAAPRAPAGGLEQTLTNESSRIASGLRAGTKGQVALVLVVRQPEACPTPDISLIHVSVGTDVSLDWGVSCVRPGEEVTLITMAPCPDCAPFIVIHFWTYEALGDANCDGVANAIDASLLLQRVVGRAEHLACQPNADVDGDGEVTATDAALVLQLDAGLIETLAPPLGSF